MAIALSNQPKFNLRLFEVHVIVTGRAQDDNDDWITVNDSEQRRVVTDDDAIEAGMMASALVEANYKDREGWRDVRVEAVSIDLLAQSIDIVDFQPMEEESK